MCFMEWRDKRSSLTERFDVLLMMAFAIVPWPSKSSTSSPLATEGQSGGSDSSLNRVLVDQWKARLDMPDARSLP